MHHSALATRLTDASLAPRAKWSGVDRLGANALGITDRASMQSNALESMPSPEDPMICTTMYARSSCIRLEAAHAEEQTARKDEEVLQQPTQGRSNRSLVLWRTDLLDQDPD